MKHLHRLVLALTLVAGSFAGAFIVAPTPASAAVVQVQDVVSSATGTATITTNWTSTTTAGDLLVLRAALRGSNTFNTPSGYTLAQPKYQTTLNPSGVAIFTKIAAGSDANPTVTTTGNGDLVLEISEYSGFPNGYTIDKTNTAQGTANGTTTDTGTTTTTTIAKEIWLGATSHNGGNTDNSPTNGFTLDHSTSSTNATTANRVVLNSLTKTVTSKGTAGSGTTIPTSTRTYAGAIVAIYPTHPAPMVIVLLENKSRNSVCSTTCDSHYVDQKSGTANPLDPYLNGSACGLTGGTACSKYAGSPTTFATCVSGGTAQATDGIKPCGTYFSNDYANKHNSLLDYLDLTAGTLSSTGTGITCTNDLCGMSGGTEADHGDGVFTNPDIGDGSDIFSEASAAGYTFNTYSEDMGSGSSCVGYDVNNGYYLPGFTISSVTESGSTATFTTSTAHGYSSGVDIVVSGVGVNGYNGTWKLTAVTSTTFTATLPTSGLANSSGGTASALPSYVLHHNQTAYEGVSGGASACSLSGDTNITADQTTHVFTGTGSDQLDVNNLPDLSFIVPNMCHNGHDTTSACLHQGGIGGADIWLQANLPAIIGGSGQFSTSAPTVIVTTDESIAGDKASSSTVTTGGGGNIFTVAIGPGISPGTDTADYTHFSLLAAIDCRFGLSYQGGATTATKLPIGTGGSC